MLFPTIDFAIFFGVVYVGAWALNRRVVAWKLFMLAASYYFYAYWDWRFCFLLLASTVIAHLGAEGITRAATITMKKAALAASLTGLLGLLGWFKYYGFVSVNYDNAIRGIDDVLQSSGMTRIAELLSPIAPASIASYGFGIPRLLPLLTPTLPIAISFFTFMAASYVIDVYRGSLVRARPLDLAVYLSFFPHLVAGPIVRGGELLPQIRRPRDAHGVDMSRACVLILSGLFKKIVISSYMSSAIVDPVFASPGAHSAPEVLFAVWGYAVEIYADFSGYTDIAIGVALLLGIKFPVNFNRPYTARTLQDFWRRWHMTLSRWLRDYLYIPLGGNRGGDGQMARNVMITMILGGLWHGADWTFLAWGALHGAGQVTGHLRRAARERRGLPALDDSTAAKTRQRFLTFQYVSLGWLFFNASSMSNAFQLLGRLFDGWTLSSPLVTPLLVATIAAMIAVQYLPRTFVERSIVTFGRAAAPVQVVFIGLVLLVTTTLGPNGVAPFIYYRF